MADFQSFLFQNMQMIGLEEQEDPERKVSKSSGSSASSHSSQSMTKRQPDGKIFKAFGSISGSTTETYLSNSHRKQAKSAEPDPYDLNSQQPNLAKKKLAHSSCESFPEPPAESAHFFAKKDQMFESKVMDLDMNYVMGDDDDSKSLSSPETNLKFNFKSSTPVIHQTKYDSSSQSERHVESPKVLRRKKSLNYRKFSPCRSIFDKKTMSKASLNSFNEDESFAKSNHRPSSNYLVTSMLFDRKKVNMAHKSNTSSESDLDANSSLESLLMEPYLVKFEEELIKNSKCEIIKDLSSLNHSLALAADQQSGARGQKNLFQKYFSEIKNLTLKKKSGPLKKPLDAELFNKVDHAEELVYDEQDEDQDQEEMATNSPLDKDNLKLASKAHIPWQSLDTQSSDQLLDMVIGNLNQTVDSEQFPLLYSKKGNKISKNQVKRWFDLLEKLAQGELSKGEEAEPAKSRLYSSKQFLINKKRQFMEKVSKKKCKTEPHLDASGSGSDICGTASKLYANVVPHETKRSRANPRITKKEADYENESFVSGKKSPRKLKLDHFYNEITDLEQRQAAIRHKNRERERVERSAPSNLMCQKNKELLQQIYDYTQESSHDSTSNLIFKRNIAAIAKLKSPERKILYNEWFTILKRMEKDPKFDLETLVRTRGRFTDNDKISYRTKLMEKGDKIRTARSEPNFSTMFSTSRAGRTRNGVNTTPAVRAHRESDPAGSKSDPNPKTAKAEPNALKLTLEKSDINKIKNLLKKKDKSLKIDLTNLKERTNMRKMQHRAELEKSEESENNRIKSKKSLKK
ncbi:hypothetical protein BpHYR1_025715 [Brachionus plicatilis]|uniref:Uncharacterized protein n=1 Tax=Brachionus plicatilis TaxID=10195 RepID=A0A3M7SGW3_BRAPC|nr:hypothetical protein BpHYR1_025715 [Brachionus plicatilis]